MPHRVDFSEIKELKTIEVKPDGWIDPLFVEYGLGLHHDVPCYMWRVKGTTHTFVIPISRMEFLSSGEYASHFKEALEGFRKDYLEWKGVGFMADWMQEYRKEYGAFIMA